MMGSSLRLTVAQDFNEVFNTRSNAFIPSHLILQLINATADCNIFVDSKNLTDDLKGGMIFNLNKDLIIISSTIHNMILCTWILDF